VYCAGRGKGAPLGSSIVSRESDQSRSDLSGPEETAGGRPDGRAGTPAVSASTVTETTVNFALHTRVEVDIFVCIFPPPLDQSAHPCSAVVTRDMLAEVLLCGRTGDVRHVLVGGVPEECAYAFRIQGVPRLLHDVHARFSEGRPASLWGMYEGEHQRFGGAQDDVTAFVHSFPTLRGGKCDYPPFLSRIVGAPESTSFDWGLDKPPRTRVEETVIYEAHVRGLTAALEPCTMHHRGTFAAAITRIPHLKSLGVTAVQLLPIGEFNELDMHTTDELRPWRHGQGHNEVSSRRLNFWGYAPVQPASFTPMSRYGQTPVSAPAELKAFVKALHEQGMECYLDLVFNHVGNSSCSLHFFGVNSDYFMHSRRDPSAHSNVSGCGNTLAPNLPAMLELVIQSLRWWVSEYHIDGFRLDAAGVLARDEKEGCLTAPQVLAAIAADPLLQDVKLIVEPWDAGEAVGSPNYLNGNFPFGDRFLEWNPDFSRTVRKFIRGVDGSSGAFCKLIRGSRSKYHDRRHGSCHSVNYLSCHDGFSLYDSVSYIDRTNADGHAEETAGNCGVEGPTTNVEVLRLRQRQTRNMILALVLARGVIMLQQGDELCATKHGNNNSYDIDGAANFLAADAACPRSEPSGWARAFWAQALVFRQTHRALLRGNDFYDRPGLSFTWTMADGGPRRSRRSADSGGEFVAWIVHDGSSCLYMAFNAGPAARETRVPAPPQTLSSAHARWQRVCDTADEGAGFSVDDDAQEHLWPEATGGVLQMESFSAVILACRRGGI
jgi:glycogen debranching enzyme GlgX